MVIDAIGLRRAHDYFWALDAMAAARHLTALYAPQIALNWILLKRFVAALPIWLVYCVEHLFAEIAALTLAM